MQVNITISSISLLAKSFVHILVKLCQMAHLLDFFLFNAMLKLMDSQLHVIHHSEKLSPILVISTSYVSECALVIPLKRYPVLPECLNFRLHLQALSPVPIRFLIQIIDDFIPLGVELCLHFGCIIS